VCRIFRSAKIFERYRSDRDSYGQNDDERDAIPVRTGQFLANQPWSQKKRQQKGGSSADNNQPTHFPSFFAGKQLAGLRSREKHQQQKAEPVNEVERTSLMVCGVYEP
jgi:hypothetical protein